MKPDSLRLGPGVAVGVTEAMIAEVVHAFYGRIRTDPILGPIFLGAIDDWDAHLAKMCDFWSSVLLMSGRFHGTPMAVHIRLSGPQGGLGPDQFGRWLRLFGETVAEICPPDAAALFGAKAQMIAQSLQLGIAAHRGELPPLRPAVHQITG